MGEAGSFDPGEAGESPALSRNCKEPVISNQ
jgi:hypothetical protein